MPMKKANSRHKYMLCKLKNKINKMRHLFLSSELYEEKAVPVDVGESQLVNRQNWQQLYQKCMSYDIISFDVFDTLIFRCFSSPADVFYLIGVKLSYPGFRKIRMEAEQKAREIAYKKNKTFEVTLEEIWKEVERESGIPSDEGIITELECELQCCTANPYMKQLVYALKHNEKKLLVTSDMYLNQSQISNILTACGYPKFSDIFISSEYKVSKSNGDLYEIIRNTFGKNKRYLHVGDHYEADVKNSRKYGFSSIYYANVNVQGNRYRAMDLSSFTGSIYRGIVNAHLYSGWKLYSKDYEYGYIYGGLFVVGYCRFIHDFASKNHIEKLLFLSRDGYLLHKVYKLLYPDEASAVYAFWSRSAALKITASRFRQEYFKRYLTHKENQGYSIDKILEEMDLSSFTELLCESAKICKIEELTHRNSFFVKKYLIENWSDVEACYQEQREAGRQYYSSLLKGIKKAAAIDIGWLGSGAFMLDYAVRHIWQLDCSITGIIAGTNSRHTFESDAGESFLVKKSIVSYLYSPAENRDIWRFHNPSRFHNLYWELLLGAPFGSLKGFYLDEKGQGYPVFKKMIQNKQRILEIHRGILDFVHQFLGVESKIGIQIPISGRDAYGPMLLLQSPKNEKAMKSFQELLDDPFVN